MRKSQLTTDGRWLTQHLEFVKLWLNLEVVINRAFSLANAQLSFRTVFIGFYLSLTLVNASCF